MVDVLGKSDRHIARVVSRRFEPGHSKEDWPYVVNVLRPDIIDFPDDAERMAGSGFHEHYRRISDGPVGFFVRTDSTVLRPAAPES
jgi:hypothetical protein